MNDEAKRNIWSMVNTAMLVLMTITGFFVVRWMNEIEGKMKDIVGTINSIRSQIESLKSDRDFEKGRIQGIREALDAQTERRLKAQEQR